MRTLAIGLIAATGIALAVPAQADDVRVGVGVNGVRVGVGDRDRDWHRHYARERDVVVHREGERHCRVTIIHRDGMTKRIKRCRD